MRDFCSVAFRGRFPYDVFNFTRALLICFITEFSVEYSAIDWMYRRTIRLRTVLLLQQFIPSNKIISQFDHTWPLQWIKIPTQFTNLSINKKYVSKNHYLVIVASNACFHKLASTSRFSTFLKQLLYLWLSCKETFLQSFQKWSMQTSKRPTSHLNVWKYFFESNKYWK